MTDREVTPDALFRILQDAAGEADGDGIDGDDALDVAFDALGYDSIALLETASRITREYGIQLEDDAVTNVHTPRELLHVVNDSA